MAGSKISQLPVLINANVHGGDALPIVDSVAGETKQISISQLDLRYQGVPNGGTTQQVLAKASGTDKDVYWKSLSKNDVGLGLVDNTSDANKPISTATQTALNLKANTSALSAKADTATVNSQLATKQDKLPNGTDGEVLTLVSGAPVWAPSGGGPGAVTSVFGRSGTVTAQVGDYDKTMIGLDQVDNTSDLDKPISTLTQTALNGKQASLPSGSNTQVLTLVAGSPAWVTPSTGIPNGGTTGQALVKNSNTNGDVGWATVESGVSVSNTQVLSAAATISLLSKLVQRVKIQGATAGAEVTLPTSGLTDGQVVYVAGVSDSSPANLMGRDYTLGVMDQFIWDSGLATWFRCGA